MSQDGVQEHLEDHDVELFTLPELFYPSFSSSHNKKITNLSKPRRVERRLMVVQLIIFLYKMRNEAIGLMTWFVKE